MTRIYNAPKPEYSNWEWFKFIAVRTVFPPVLLWDVIKFVANKLLGEIVRNLVLPAQNQTCDHIVVNDDTVSNYNERNLICEKHEVVTHDDVHLDTFEVTHTAQRNIDPKYQKYIINFEGNGMCY